MILLDKKEYITNQLKKAVHKKYENYCITRIIHKLDRLDVQFITQQLFKRPDGKFAYSDLYFPQLNISVEIDESHHLTQKEADEQRTKDIISADKETRKKYTGLEDVVLDPIKEYRIKASYLNTIEEINKQTDDITDIIREKINSMGDKFIPWKNIYEKASYYINKGYISRTENARFKTIDDIGELFNMEKVPMGYKVHGYVPIINDSEYFWCPTLKLSDDEVILNNAENTISKDGKYIFEYFKKDNEIEVRKVLNSDVTRYVFGRYRDETGSNSYKFIGVYKLDRERTLKDNVRSWKRDAESIDLNQYN